MYRHNLRSHARRNVNSTNSPQPESQRLSLLPGDEKENGNYNMAGGSFETAENFGDSGKPIADTDLKTAASPKNGNDRSSMSDDDSSSDDDSQDSESSSDDSCSSDEQDGAVAAAALNTVASILDQPLIPQYILDEASYLRDRTWRTYVLLHVNPDEILLSDNKERSFIPTLDMIHASYVANMNLHHETLPRQQYRTPNVFRTQSALFGISVDDLAVLSGGNQVQQSSSSSSDPYYNATQVRLPYFMSAKQRNVISTKAEGLLDRPVSSRSIRKPTIQKASDTDLKLIDDALSRAPIGRGGFKEIFAVPGDSEQVLARVPGRHHDLSSLLAFAARSEFVVYKLLAGFESVLPHFSTILGSPMEDYRLAEGEGSWDDTPGPYYAIMPKHDMTLDDFLCNDPEPDAVALESLAMQLGFTVLAGQAVFNLRFSDIKSDNLMVDDVAPMKLQYFVSVGSKVFVFSAPTRGGGLLKLIDHSTTKVEESKVECLQGSLPTTTHFLTPVEYFLLDTTNASVGFPRDVHNIVLTMLFMFARDAMWSWKQLVPPQPFEIDVPKPFFEDPDEWQDYTQYLYRYVVLLSEEGTFILDVLAKDPTFGLSPHFEQVVAENKDLFESKDFFDDVRKYSLLTGSAFSEMRSSIGNRKTKLLWKGMAPNQALRPTLPAFMFAFFDEQMTEVKNPEKELPGWLEAHAEEEEELVPISLFLSETHFRLLHGENSDAFALTSD